MNQPIYSPIVELRMYALHAGKRDTLIELFDREFVETQEAVGMQVIGQFYDLDDPDRFVWLRGFNDMEAREQSLKAFYGGPIWKTHREAANATMIDSNNVLLLRRAHPTSGFSLAKRTRRSTNGHAGFVAAMIYPFHTPVTSQFVSYFESTIHPVLMEAGIPVLAYFVTEDSPNTFPQLPVRDGEHVFVWFAGFRDPAEHEHCMKTLTQLKPWTDEIARYLRHQLRGKPEQLRLIPTTRSRLRGMP